jgi:hypothetical protein
MQWLAFRVAVAELVVLATGKPEVSDTFVKATGRGEAP